MMRRLIGVIGLFLVTLPAFCQSRSKYEVATIVEVTRHQAAGTGGFDVTSYDVSVKVGDTIYVALYTPPLGESDVKYFAGRDLLVLVGKTTIAYNDILGRSFEAPIQSQRPATESEAPKKSKESKESK
jgi:hypothetical protein